MSMDEPNQNPGGVVLWATDLMWISRISGTASELGIACAVVRDGGQLVDAVKARQPVCVLIDLEAAGKDLVPTLERLKALDGTECRLVAFGSHVAVDVLESARRSGCAPVLSRGELARDLVSLLRQWAQTGLE